jgi:hypothetical protein
LEIPIGTTNQSMVLALTIDALPQRARLFRKYLANNITEVSKIKNIVMKTVFNIIML